MPNVPSLDRIVFVFIAARVALAGLIAVPLAAGAQSGAPAIRLGEAIAKPAEQFSSIGDVVELAEGRLLVSDDRDMRLVVIEANGTAREIGRRGGGPGEFRAVGSLFPTADGGAHLVDFALRRLLPIRPDGALGDATGYRPGLLVRGADASGTLYAEAFLPRLGTVRNDSMYILRWTPDMDRADTLMMIDAGVTKWTGPRDMPRQPFPDFETWTVLPNGDVLVVRSTDYRFTLVRDGKALRSFSVPFARETVTDAQKKTYMDKANAEPVRVMGQPGGAASAGPPVKYEFPRSYPPFGGEGIGGAFLMVARNGQVWVELLAPPGARERRYDVIDVERGARAAQVTMPVAHRIVGFGAGKVFVAEPDQDDIQYVRSYRYPDVR